MRLVAVDGMCLDLPDNQGERGGVSAIRATTADVARSRRSAWWGSRSAGTRAVLGAATSPLATGEQPLARQLLPKLRPGDLLLADRKLPVPTACSPMCSQPGCTLLWAREKSDVDLPVLAGCWPDGTYPVTDRRPGRLAPACAAKGASGGDIPGVTVRVIEYSVASQDGSETSETFTLITDILDPALPVPGAGRRRLRLPLAAGDPASMSWKPRCAAGRCRGAALEVPADDPAGDLRDAVLLPGRSVP